MIAFPDGLFFCYTLCKKAMMQKQVFQSYSMVDSLLLSVCFISGHQCACLSRKNPQLKFELLIMSARMCTLNVIQLTEWHSGKFHCLISVSMTASVFDEGNNIDICLSKQNRWVTSRKLHDIPKAAQKCCQAPVAGGLKNFHDFQTRIVNEVSCWNHPGEV